jgi:hypothetical protein
MLNVSIELINCHAEEGELYRKEDSEPKVFPFLVTSERNIYDSDEICSWLLSAHKGLKINSFDSAASDFRKYKSYSGSFEKINKLFFVWAKNGFLNDPYKTEFHAAVVGLIKLTSFESERNEISYLNSSIIGLISRFIFFEEEFSNFITKHDLYDWYCHLCNIVNFSDTEYHDFGEHFYNYVRNHRGI